MRALRVVAVALLLVTAGCGGLGGSSGTATPNGTTAETADDAGGDAGALTIPGVEDGRLTDSAALVDAHRRALTNDSFESRLRSNLTQRVPTSSNTTQLVETTITQRVVAERGARPYRYRRTDRATGTTFQAWGNDTVQAVRGLQNDRVVTRRVGQPESPAAITTARPLAEYLSLGEYRVVERTTRDGERLAVLRADGLAVENDSGLFVSGSENVSNFSATAVVDGDGRIRSLSLTADYTIDGEAATVDLTYEVVRIGGVSFEQPDWAAEIIAASDNGGDSENRTAAARETPAAKHNG